MSASHPIDSAKRIPYYSFQTSPEALAAAVAFNIRDTQEKLLAEQQAANSLARYQLRVLERIDRRLAKRVKLK